MRYTRHILAVIPLWVALAWCQQDAVQFNRDIRPIFSDKCYTCHGPDKGNRKANLRFDIEAAAKGDLGNGHMAIVPGDLAKSEIVRRVSTASKGLRMPPVYTGRDLTPREISLIQRWIEQGAKWQKHWSFIPPLRPDLPAVANRDWPRNGIDYFILDRLQREGLTPSPEADREALIRRVSLDLTGLPPTPAEMDAFLADKSPHAYERVVDRLLASPRYGERMGARWLDGARYADTNGYQTDAERSMWRWRDWVIDAFNRNKPYDQFAVEQIAGDMLPHATLDQKIASGFNRNHRGNGEGGSIAAEFLVEYVVDRLETTSTVFLGLTMGCARCHDHKYDPLSQKEFYQFFAFFNNIEEMGRVFKYGNSPPLIKAPTPVQQADLSRFDAKVTGAEQHFTALQPEIAKAQHAWEKSVTKSGSEDWSLTDGLVAHLPFDGSLAGKTATPTWSDGAPEFVAGKLGKAASFDGKRYVDAGKTAAFGFYDKFSVGAWIYPTAENGAIVSKTEDVSEALGYSLYLKNGKVQFNLVQRWLDDALRMETQEPLALNQWHHVLASYDGSRVATGVRIYIDGESRQLKTILDELNQTFDSPQPLRIGAGGGPENRFHGYIDDVRIYSDAVSPAEAAVIATPASVSEIAAIPAAQRTEAQTDKLAWCFLETRAPENMRAARQELREARKLRLQFFESVPTVMVMQEREKTRDTFLLIRGAYDRPGDKVAAAVPAVLTSPSTHNAGNRLELARWLVDPENPLTARVAVNRFWQMYFGTGIVKTVEDFGSQGEWPTHPELLDWLATEFVRTGWDIKGMQKTIVMSATYRQSSKVTPALLQKDPENRLLSHATRVRLPAEMVRDQALSVSGLLVEKLGGPSVKPYQPAGLWKELSGAEDYKQDRGEDLYRRSLYSYWKRTAPPPAMMNFDAAGRETCVVRETRTNTPLQALTLMNDVTYVEAARMLAERMLTEGGATPEERIAFAFRLAAGRRPHPVETRILLDSLRYHRDTYQTDPEAALKLVSAGEHARNEKLDTRELAGYAAVASMILNLDAVVTKE